VCVKSDVISVDVESPRVDDDANEELRGKMRSDFCLEDLRGVASEWPFGVVFPFTMATSSARLWTILSRSAPSSSSS